MFQSKASLNMKAKTGTNRSDYIKLLASEFNPSLNVDSQEQITANLANFSYDPINYGFLLENCVHEIFLQLINTEHESLILHGIAGLCNLCLDDRFHNFIIAKVHLIENLLKHQSDHIKINAVACLLLLIRPETKQLICSSRTKATIEDLCLSSNECLSKIAAYFVTDHFMEYDDSEQCATPPKPFIFSAETDGNADVVTIDSAPL